MKTRVVLAVAVVFGLPTAALADMCGPTEQVAFACKIKDSSRQVSVCESGDGLYVYRYGKPGIEPELTISATPTEVTYNPWNGVGSSMWSDLSFNNGGYRYQLVNIAERSGDGREEGYLNVFEPGADEPSFSAACREETIQGTLDGLDMGG